MKSEGTCIIIMDLQERLITSIRDKEEVCWNTRRLLDAASLLNIDKEYTEQNPQKLGKSLNFITERIKKNPHVKLSFSCATKNDLLEKLEVDRIKNIVLCGIESHICIQQTTIDFINIGFNVFLPIDAIGSRKQLDKEISLKRMEKIGAILTTTEATIFEWCETSEHKEFKQISNLAKENSYIY